MVAQRADENIRENSSKKKAAVGNDAVEHTEKAEVAQALFLWDTADVPNLQPRSDQRVNKLCGAEQHANDGQQRFNGKPAHRNKRNHQQIDGVRGGAQKDNEPFTLLQTLKDQGRHQLEHIADGHDDNNDVYIVCICAHGQAKACQVSAVDDIENDVVDQRAEHDVAAGARSGFLPVNMGAGAHLYCAVVQLSREGHGGFPAFFL